MRPGTPALLMVDAVALVGFPKKTRCQHIWRPVDHPIWASKVADPSIFLYIVHIQHGPSFKPQATLLNDSSGPPQHAGKRKGRKFFSSGMPGPIL